MNGASSDEQNASGAEETIVRPKDAGNSGLRPADSTTTRSYLEVISGSARGQRFYLGSGEHIIGRSPEVDIPLPDESISRQHARVLFRNETFILSDLDSKNGTFLNDTRVHECPLHTGDEITVGNHSLQFLSETVRVNSL